ncbi:aminoglycoside phosphotransferase family protein [Peribacillus sp. SCS-26]|uniref:aminoglycoside phosphotransferase family protein n=1 Tax=Paraperibacillus marinus TaxID=3115295 RepID=UPI0039061536
MPVPQVLDLWEGDEEQPGALLLSALPGAPCTGVITESTAYEIGLNHASLHEVPIEGYGHDTAAAFIEMKNQDWRLYVSESFHSILEECRDITGGALYAESMRHFEGLFPSLPEPDGPCLVHYDFRSGNILVKDSKVTGIVDFESSRGGASEVDFTKVNSWFLEGNPSLMNAYKSGYESIRKLPPLEQLLPFYTFFDALGSVNWCKKRGMRRNSALLERSMAILMECVRKGG